MLFSKMLLLSSMVNEVISSGKLYMPVHEMKNKAKD